MSRKWRKVRVEERKTDGAVNNGGDRRMTDGRGKRQRQLAEAGKNG